MNKLLIYLLVLFTFFTGVVEAQTNHSVEWSYKNVPLKQILSDIEATENVTFSYGNIKIDKNVSIEFKGLFADGLNELFGPENIIYKIIDDQIVLKYATIKGEDIKGRVMDLDADYPLIGATIIVIESDPLIGTITDEDGYFRISNLEVGRYDLSVAYIGYDSKVIPQVQVTTGKEAFITVGLTESFMELEEVVIMATVDPKKPLNEMTTLSARSFSMEEAKRYAAAISDPARMAQSYAGVSSGGDDLSNEIIIRGNSARGLLWRLDGIEIPNPNHFGDLGSGGGNISMLSATTLSNSDFYTGAFPAEFGNALSGVFDLKMRNGNIDKREHSIMFGNLGLEVGTEGYFKKGTNASYLFNYRFSTLGFMGKFLPSLQDAIPAYQDLSFKINVPTQKAGTFSLIGLGGISTEEETGIRDSTQWLGGSSHYDYNEKSRLGVIGLAHNYVFRNFKSSLHSSVSASAYTYTDLTELLLASRNYELKNVDQTNFGDYSIAVASTFNHKFNARHKIKVGVTLNHKIYNYEYETIEPDSTSIVSFFKNKGNAQFLESYFQWKYKFGDNWTLNSGINFSYLMLNNTFSLDPRIGIKWDFKPNQSLAFAAGLHSRPEHTSTYLMERIENGIVTSPNLQLEMTKAVHLVLAYDLNFAKDFRFKAEAYYQFLYNVPVSVNQSSGFSVLNTSGVFDIIYMNDQNGEVLVSEGTGVNYGIDLTLEKFFSKGYYFLVTGSLFDSKYSTLNNEYFRSIYANNFIFNALGGKEFTVGKKKNNLFAINGKVTCYGGRRQTPIDEAASIETGQTVYKEDVYFTDRLAPYYRFDLGIAYTINARRSSHSIMFDVQNLTNHFNTSFQYYEPDVNQIVTVYQNGAIPIINYRVEF